jgi:hypothetical protein
MSTAMNRSGLVRLVLLVVGPACFAFSACSSSPARSSGSAGTSGGGGGASAGAGTGGQAGDTAGAGGGSAGAIGAAGTVGSTGASGSGGGGGPGGTGGSAGTGVGGETGGVGGPDASPDGTLDAAAACPGAGKALHFEDDLKGKATRSMQLLADLGADLPIGNTARTIELWLYMEGAESWKAEHSIVEYGGTGRCQAFGIDGGDNGVKDPPQFDPFTFSAGGPCTGDDNNALSPPPPRTGWVHLAWVYDPAGQLAYGGQLNLNFLFTVNGVPQPIPAKKQTGTLLTMKTLLSIGSGQMTDNGFTGKMDEFRVWNIARTDKDIADNYKVILRGDESGLVAYYHFDEGTGMTAKDGSAKHHDALFATDGGRPVPTWVDSTDLVLTCKP